MKEEKNKNTKTIFKEDVKMQGKCANFTVRWINIKEKEKNTKKRNKTSRGSGKQKSKTVSELKQQQQPSSETKRCVEPNQYADEGKKGREK